MKQQLIMEELITKYFSYIWPNYRNILIINDFFISINVKKAYFSICMLTGSHKAL